MQLCVKCTCNCVPNWHAKLSQLHIQTGLLHIKMDYLSNSLSMHANTVFVHTHTFSTQLHVHLRVVPFSVKGECDTNLVYQVSIQNGF